MEGGRCAVPNRRPKPRLLEEGDERVARLARGDFDPAEGYEWPAVEAEEQPSQGTE